MSIVKILPVNYILEGILSKFSIANNLRYTVCHEKFFIVATVHTQL